MSDKIEIGRAGENLAAEFLERKGWKIVVRNFRYGKSEIDLIASRDNWLLFVEVKARSSTQYGQPESFVDSKKVSQIYYAAEGYIFRNNWQGHVRFDVIAVTLGPKPEVVHFEDAIN